MITKSNSSLYSFLEKRTGHYTQFLKNNWSFYPVLSKLLSLSSARKKNWIVYQALEKKNRSPYPFHEKTKLVTIPNSSKTTAERQQFPKNHRPVYKVLQKRTVHSTQFSKNESVTSASPSKNMQFIELRTILVPV